MIPSKPKTPYHNPIVTDYCNNDKDAKLLPQHHTLKAIEQIVAKLPNIPDSKEKNGIQKRIADSTPKVNPRFFKLLDAGCGNGLFSLLFLKSFLNSAKKKGYNSIIIDAFDEVKANIDEFEKQCSVENLKQQLGVKTIVERKLPKGWEVYEEAMIAYHASSENQAGKLLTEATNSVFDRHLLIGEISIIIRLFQFDWEKMESFVAQEGKYNVIVANTFIQHLGNWRLGTLKLLQGLKKEGIFIIGHWSGDVAFLDGNYRDLNHVENETFFKFLKTFRQIRNEYFCWYPEISLSNITQLKYFLRPFFGKDESILREKVVKRCTLQKIYEELIETQILDFFWVGLTEKDMTIIWERIEKKLEKYLKKRFEEIKQEAFDLSVGYTYILFTGFDNLELDRNFRWHEESLLSKCRQVVDDMSKSGKEVNVNKKKKSVHELSETSRKIKDICQHTLDIIATHDVFFPKTTFFLGLYPWSLEKRDWEPFQLLTLNLKHYPFDSTNGKEGYEQYNGLYEKMCKYIAYCIYTIKIKYGLNRFLLEEDQINSVLTIVYATPRPELVLNVKVKRDVNGDIKEVVLIVHPKELDDGDFLCKMNNEKEEYVKRTLREIWQREVGTENKKQPNLYRIHHIKANLARVLLHMKEISKLCEEGCFYINEDLKEDLVHDFTNKLQKTCLKGILKENSDIKLAEVLVGLMYSYLEKGEQVTCIPAKNVPRKESIDRNNKMLKMKSEKEKALGLYNSNYNGMILHEKNAVWMGSEEEAKEEKKTDKLAICKWKMHRQRFNILENINYVIFCNICIKGWAQQAINEAFEGIVRAAIAAVMSRNGSHHLGSNVLSAVSSSFNDDMLDNRMLFQYIQQRLEYIAQVTTQFPTWTYPTWLLSDLMMRFYMQRHLLHNLARLENLKADECNRSIKQKNAFSVIDHYLVIKVKKKGAAEGVYITNRSNQASGNGHLALTEDIQVAIPGGFVGYQAFYTILENVIRNAAKYNWDKLNKEEKQKLGCLEITIEYEPQEEEAKTRIRIWSNSEIHNEYESNLAERLHNILKQPLIERSSKAIEKRNWGLAEIKISAGFLTKQDLISIGSKLDEKNLFIRAITYSTTEEGQEKKVTAYEFDIPNPKEIAIVMNKKEQEKSWLKQWESGKKQGITWITHAQAKQGENKFDYELVVLFYEKEELTNDKKKRERNKIHAKLEQYPYRLFLVVKTGKEEQSWVSDDPILKKRLVLIRESELKEAIKEEIDIKVWLLAKWIAHIQQINELKEGIDLMVDIRPGNSKVPSNITDQDLLMRVYNEFGVQIVESVKHVVGIVPYGDSNIEIEVEKLTFLSLNDISSYCDKEEASLLENTSTLAEYWLKASELEINKSWQKFIKKLIQQILNSYLVNIMVQVSKTVETIETLPIAFKASKQDVAKEDFWDKKGKQLPKLIRDMVNWAETGLKISYSRHDDLRQSRVTPPYLYREAISGSQVYYSVISQFRHINAYLQQKLTLQLIENACLSLTIIDERVATYLASNDKSLLSKFNLLRINIPNVVQYNHKECNLVEKVDQIKDRRVFNLDELKNNKKVNVLIVHQGVLEKVGLIEKNKSQQSKRETGQPISLVDEKFLEIKEYIPFVVLTSGRGEPEMRSNVVKFIPYSSINTFLLKDYPEKYLLTEMLMKLINDKPNPI